MFKKSNHKGLALAILALFLSFSVMSAELLTQAEMDTIEAFQSDLKKTEGQRDVFKFALKKIKANPSKVEAILKSLNLWEKIND
jgi:O-antigen ligase